MTPGWLPEFCPTDGEWPVVVAALYKVFQRDIVAGLPLVDGFPVRWQRQVGDGYEKAFWHLITKADVDGERLFDPRRAERLAWCASVLRHHNDPTITRWRYREKGRIRLYLWLETCDYVVVLEERSARCGQEYFLITAHHLDGESRRRNLRRKYEKREP